MCSASTERAHGPHRRARRYARRPATGASATRTGRKTRSSISSSSPICSTANWLHKTVADADGMDHKAQARAAFYASQFADAIAPTNFVADQSRSAARDAEEQRREPGAAVSTICLSDLERGQGSSQHPPDDGQFRRSAATSRRRRARSCSATSCSSSSNMRRRPKTAYETPLLIFPPWINKFYILDLQPKNSFVRWAVEHGYTVFMVSWVNPDSRLASKSFEDYMREGIFAALDAVEKATGQTQVNAIGYCIAGTLLARDARLHRGQRRIRRQDQSPPPSSPPRSISPRPAICRSSSTTSSSRRWKSRCAKSGGVLEGSKMAMTFNHAARQRPDLVLRGQQLPAGQGAGAVRSALLELRHHAHAAEAASRPICGNAIATTRWPKRR